MSSEYKNKKTDMEQEIKRRTIVSFSVFLCCLACGCLLFFRLYNEPQTANDMQPTLRKGLESNEKLFSMFYSSNREAKAYQKADAAKKIRVNGDIGMDGLLDTATWRLR